MEHFNWGLPVAIDLFAAGMGAAACMVAVIADWAGKGKKYNEVRLAGALVAPWPAIVGVLLLVVDLGQPLRFWEMILRRGEGFSLDFPYLMFNPGSAMSWGTWVLTLFVITSLLNLAANIVAIPFPWGWRLTRITGAVTLPFAIFTATYTGVLISATSNPLWKTFVLPLLFVASALVSGVAVVIFVLAAIKLFNLLDFDPTTIPKLEKLNSKFMLWQGAMLVLFLLTGIGSQGLLYMIFWPFGILFWLLVMGTGLLLPLKLGLKGQAQPALQSLGVSALVLVGGLLLRYIILISGQIV
jgi:polysulfide reductase chain C